MAFSELDRRFGKIEDAEPTKYWKKYEKGIDYIVKKKLVSKTNKNWNFFIGKQWENVEAGGEELPFLNFIHPNIMRKVTTVYSNRMTATFSDMDGRAELQEVYDKLNQHYANCWEKSNQDVRMRTMTKDGCVTGDGLQYFGTGNVSDVQFIQNTAILYGDESEPDINRQPHIILHQRESVASVRKQAEANGIPEEERQLIIADNETEYLIGNRDEVEEDTASPDSKVTTLVYMEKKEGAIWVAKCTKHVIYEPLHKICTIRPDGSEGKALTRYPLVKFSWENFPNDARGVSQVEGLIPNQIEINKTLARRSMTTKMTAFPRLAYDSTMIQNPEALQKVGMPIEVNTGGVNSVSQMISYLNPAQTNDEPRKLTSDLLEITQELSGSGDTTMGNIELQRVAASAINAVNEAANSMHDETVANLQSANEDMAMLWLELWQVYSPNGIEVQMTETDPLTGEEFTIVENISAEELDQLKPSIRIDITKDNAYTREAAQQVIDGLLEKQLIDLEEYTELAEVTSPVPKTKLENIIKRREIRRQMEEQRQMEMMAQNPAMNPEIQQMTLQEDVAMAQL